MQRFQRMPMCIGYVLAALQLLVGQVLWAAPDSSDFPTLTGHVVDNAEILDKKTRQEIDAFLTVHERETGNQIVVAAIDSLHGETVEEYATALFRHWGLGQKDKNNGVLLLVAMKDHKMRIEVGYGLEGKLTDASSKLILDDIITPAFKNAEYGMGIKQATQEISEILGSQHQYMIFSHVPDDMQFPDFANYFTDNLNLLETLDQEQINQFLANLEKASGTKVAIISQESIGNVQPQAYTSALFKHWHLRPSDMLIVISTLKHTLPNDKDLHHSVDIKVGSELQKQIPPQERHDMRDSLKAASRTEDFTFSLKDLLQEMADKLDPQQAYPHLLEPTDLLPSVIASFVLLLIFLIGWFKTSADSILHLLCTILCIASIIAFLSYGAFYLDGEPDYLNDGLVLNFIFYFMLCIIFAIPLKLISSTIKYPGSRGSRSYSGSSSTTYSSSSSGGGYSGGGGSSGGGGASGGW